MSNWRSSERGRERAPSKRLGQPCQGRGDSGRTTRRQRRLPREPGPSRDRVVPKNGGKDAAHLSPLRAPRASRRSSNARSASVDRRCRRFARDELGREDRPRVPARGPPSVVDLVHQPLRGQPTLFLLGLRHRRQRRDRMHAQRGCRRSRRPRAPGNRKRRCSAALERAERRMSLMARIAVGGSDARSSSMSGLACRLRCVRPARCGRASGPTPRPDLPRIPRVVRRSGRA